MSTAIARKIYNIYYDKNPQIGDYLKNNKYIWILMDITHGGRYYTLIELLEESGRLARTENFDPNKNYYRASYAPAKNCLPKYNTFFYRPKK